MGLERSCDEMIPILKDESMVDAECFCPEGAGDIDFKTGPLLSVHIADDIVTPVKVRKRQCRVPRRAVGPKINIYLLTDEVLGEWGTAQVGQASLSFALGIDQQRKTRTGATKILEVNRGR